MDPKQCLLDARMWLREECYHEVNECLFNYWHWRRQMGGFEPEVCGIDGDKFAREIFHRMTERRGATNESN